MNLHIPTKSQHFSTRSNKQLNQAIRIWYTQKQLILKYLIKHKSLTTIQAHQSGILSPSARIKELRNDGHIIQTVPVPGCNGMAEYYLIKLAKPKNKKVKP